MILSVAKPRTSIFLQNPESSDHNSINSNEYQKSLSNYNSSSSSNYAGSSNSSSSSNYAGSSSSTMKDDITISGVSSATEITMEAKSSSLEDFFQQHNKKIIIRHSVQISGYVLAALLYRSVFRKGICVIFTRQLTQFQRIFGDEWNAMVRDAADSEKLVKNLSSVTDKAKIPLLIIHGIQNVKPEYIVHFKSLCDVCPHIILEPFYSSDSIRARISEISNSKTTCFWNESLYPNINFSTMLCPISDRQKLQYEMGYAESSSLSSPTSPRFENNIYGSYRPQVKFGSIPEVNQTPKSIVVKNIDYYKYNEDYDDILDILPVECNLENVKNYYQELGQISTKLKIILTNIILNPNDRHLIIAEGHVVKVLPDILKYLAIPVLDIEDNTSKSGVIINSPSSLIFHYHIRFLHFWRIYSNTTDIIYENVQRSINDNLKVNICNYITIHQDKSQTTDSRLYEKFFQFLTNSVNQKIPYKIETKDGKISIRYV